MSMTKQTGEAMMTQKCFAIAGELYGHLQDLLGFGDLVMFAPDKRMVSYRWTFKAQGKRYGIEETISFCELEQMHSVEDFAKYLSGKWKGEYMAVTDEVVKR